MKQAPSDKASQWYEQAVRYDAGDDVYHAVKLLKLCVRLEPDWLPPFLLLAAVYKRRREWKQVLYYCKKAVALHAQDQDRWWDLGIAAAALGKDRLAKAVWQKFTPPAPQGALISLRLEHSGLFELIWAKTLDSVRAMLFSIPHPDSDLHYRDIVLFDREQVGLNIAGKRKVPVFPVLGRTKRSFFQTFTCILHQTTAQSIQTLETLCADAGIGFEIWTDASWSKTIPVEGKIPEYFGNQVFPASSDTEVWAALAAKTESDILQVLSNWRIISLGSFSNLEKWS
ncbi:MAG: hypothetical protein KBG02_12605 [Haliscomenobacter sp.]|nr:hypothetical protein [Haliscomenobacter sp.]MBK8655231.1 hypothetical protein [Haliscomenobacter sp.]MBP9077698.1 hypothetical protein [Haliscomenobacter sp.]